jgi:tetraacyldisaccharide 4'-kinase
VELQGLKNIKREMIRDFIHSLMTDRRNAPPYAPLKGILHLISLGYSLALSLRKLFYRIGIFKTSRLPMRVVSVGNITLGGTGKTPFVIMLAKLLSDMSAEPVVLTRGYGWDEQAMLKKSLGDIPLMVGEDRVRSARRAVRLYGSDTAILDDGFQYWEMARDLDIVLVDSRNPFGNGVLFPRGILREPKRSIEKADIVVFTKVNKAASDLRTLKEDLIQLKKSLVFLEAVHRPKLAYDLKAKKAMDPAYIKDKRVILISSIGDPGYFEETVRDLGARIAGHIKFGDHHNYDQRDIKEIAKVCAERNFDFLVTTEKDAVKFGRLGLSIADYALIVLSVEMEIVSGKEELLARLHSLYNR